MVPDLTMVIDVETEIGLKRARARNARTQDVETRLDEQAIEFHKKVRDAYHQLAADEPRRVRLIDGSREENVVACDVWETVTALLGEARNP